ncbi:MULTISPECIES: thioredoxin family protein [Paenibacillus]|uniref:Thioredoxin family protein n=1 Tax=Paenibacillus cucumis (ex Kampfer et al. 2016) TaxID=1776858 RepID=A0ABS7KD37_9BACL|nr:MULTISPECIES: thioredoxin family protein [Paenibacillus]MBY0201896.1 thioredoxin family protein [Paenibacillus cucumis (ex Kampfer et al. 2016)]MDP9698668.1 thiol-disulfide isomerase/thioredoxin [Paenibacillus intestini]
MNSKKKKKSATILIFLGILVVMIAALVLVNQQSKKQMDTVENAYGIAASKLNPATRELLKDPNYQQIILPADLKARIDNKDSFFVYFFASDCSHCRATTPQLMPLVDSEGIKLPQFNLREFESGWTDYNIEFTPTLVYYQDGVEKDRMVGGLKENGSDNGYTLDDYKQFFDKYKGSATPSKS